jgi:hypothetical protein
MRYSKSVYQKDFDVRLNHLLAQSRTANKLPVGLHEIRDLTFQCVVFLTSAALETYVRLIVESWVQALKLEASSGILPERTRGFIAVARFRRYFERFAYTGDESEVVSSIVNEHQKWPMLTAQSQMPNFFDGKMLHKDVSYPSQGNLKKLFGRLGIENFESQLSALLKRDVDVMIEGFQSVRTALAHAAPPALTIQDVRTLLVDMKKLVAAIDRVFFRHVLIFGGARCWK